MNNLGTVAVALRDAYDNAGFFEIRQLPHNKAGIWDFRGSTPPEGTAEIQIIEGSEYKFSVVADVGGAITIDPAEIFFPDDESGRTGRIRTGLYTGRISLRVSTDQVQFHEVDLEIRSKKLSYLEDYRWMLRDLTENFSEILLDAFAPTEQSFAPVQHSDAETLYHRFCWLKGLLETESFDASMQRISASPYVTWEDLSEERSVRKGVKPSPEVYRQLAKRRPRFNVNIAHPVLTTLPHFVWSKQSEETLDNVPNRFIKFALMKWRSEVAFIRHILTGFISTTTTRRGIAECDIVLDHLDALLSQQLFKQVGQLRTQIGANQVLQRREGYKEILHAYLQSELASQIVWEGGDDVFAAGQRDVASLYEFWVYLKLASGISQLLDVPFDLRNLFTPTPDGFRLQLKRRSAAVLAGQMRRFGRNVGVRFWYNRSFGRQTRSASWSHLMRPDFSLEMRSLEPSGKKMKPVFLHFDAKYRIESINEVLQTEESGGTRTRRAKRADLLKMHAYKDAIRYSGGAYVVYPGDIDRPVFEHHEVLPGIGAFALRPTETTTSPSAILGFVNEVLDHFSLQITQYERYRFWREESFSAPRPNATVNVAPFVPRPPRDTYVLLGYVKSQAHLEWIERTGLYNVRADDRTGAVGSSGKEAASSIVALYGRELPYVRLYLVEGAPVVWGRSQLEEWAYPSPNGSHYLCFKLRRITDDRWNETITATQIAKLLPETRGAPRAVTWEEFAVVRSLAS